MLIAWMKAAAQAAEGSGPATVVWMQEDVPSPEQRARAEKIIGTTAAHAAWADIAFPASPFGKEDEARLAALARAEADAKARWDKFDVELEIAAALAAAASPVELVRDDADAHALAEALLLEGAAAMRVVPDARFATADELAPYRVFLGSSAVLAPMVNALALQPDAVWSRDDLPDAASWARLSAIRDELKSQPVGHLQLAPLPKGAVAVLDGHPLAADAHEAPLTPGHHYLHFLVGGRIVGRRTFDAAPDGSIAVEPAVTREELSAAGNRVLEGSKDVPDDVAKAVTAVGDRGGRATATFLATIDPKGQVRVLPFGGGAAIEHKPAVTVVLAGTAGGGILLSSAFAGSIGTPAAAGAIGGDLGVEVGVYNLAIFGGTSLFLTPTEQMRYANADNTANVPVNYYVRPYGGLGVYLPRPDPGKPLFLLGVDYGWMSPGAIGVGGRVNIGVPLGGDGTWFRVELDGYRGTQMPDFPAEGKPTVSAALRLGFGRMF